MPLKRMGTLVVAAIAGLVWGFPAENLAAHGLFEVSGKSYEWAKLLFFIPPLVAALSVGLSIWLTRDGRIRAGLTAAAAFLGLALFCSLIEVMYSF